MRIEAVIGDNLRQVREDRGLTQAEVAALMTQTRGREWTYKAVSSAENGGRSLPAADVLAFAACLGTTVQALFTPLARDSLEVAPGKTVSPQAVAGYAARSDDSGRDHLVTRIVEAARVMSRVVADNHARLRAADAELREELEVMRDATMQLRDEDFDYMTPGRQLQELAQRLVGEAQPR